tara:strand:- start:24 stop:428 length:405 start_codon:yes stop_codon:yes gene_type:complete
MKFIINSAPDPDQDYGFKKIKGVGNYYVDIPLSYTINGKTYAIQANVLSDGYSIPKAAQSIFSKTMLGILAAFWHDKSHKTGIEWKFTRAESDKILRELMKYYGVGRTARWLVYFSVRAGGWKSWKKRPLSYHK